MAKKTLKNVQVVEESIYGVCLWQMPDGSFLGDGDGNFLSVEGLMRDAILEEKMRKAAIHYLGVEGSLGEPHWICGARKITSNERDDQMERLLDGHIPDIVDATRQKGIRP